MRSAAPTSESSRGRGWLRRVGPWMGIGTSPAALMVGGGVAEGNERAFLVLAVALGALALGALAVAQGVLGQRHRSRLAGLAASTLGTDGGRRIASPVLAAMMIGWFAFNTGIAGAGLAKLLGVADVLGIVIFATAMLAVAWKGLDTLSWTALVAGLATLVLAADGLRLALSDRHGPLFGDGVVTGDLGLLPAIALLVGYGAAFALRTPDFTSDLERPRHVVWCAAAGLVGPLIAFALAGGVLQIATGSWDLVDVLGRLGSPKVAYAFVALGFTGSVLTNLHSGAISLEDAVGHIDHRTGLLVVFTVGTALATLRFADQMVPYLTAMALSAPCLIGVLLIDQQRRRKQRQRWHGGAIGGWAAGIAAGGSLALAGSVYALPAGIAVAAAVTLAAARRSDRPELR